MSDREPREVEISRHFFRTSASAKAGRLSDDNRLAYQGQLIYQVRPTGGVLRRWKVVAYELPSTTPPSVQRPS